MVSLRYISSAAAIILSDELIFTTALSRSPAIMLRRTNNRLNIACSVVPRAMDSSSMSRRKRTKRRNNKRSHPPRKRQQSSSSGTNSECNYLSNSGEDDIDEWLIRSTALFLGDNSDMQSDECAFSNTEISQFSSIQEYLYHARSLMKAWTHWNSRNTLGYRRDARLTVEVLFERVLYVISHEEKISDVELAELRPTIVSLVNIIIDAWANGSKINQEAVIHAEGWFHFLTTGKMMNGMRSEKSLAVVLGADEESYRGVIKAYIRTQQKEYLDKAFGLLHEMSCGTTNQKIYPKTLTYNLILYGLANAQPSDEKNAEIAENLLKEMIWTSKGEEYDPDSNSFRQVISAWTKVVSLEAMDRANEVLDQVLNDFPHIDPDASTFNAIMTLNLRLDRVEDAISVFNKMVAIHQSGRVGTQPDIYSVNLLLKAMIRRRQHSQRQNLNEAEELLKGIEDIHHVQADVQSFNIVIDGWSKSKLPEAVSRAENLLDIMEVRCRNDSLAAKPDSYTFTSILDSIARSEHSYQRAEKVFHRIENMYEDGMVEKLTIPVYNAYLNALVSSKDMNALDRVESIFDNMRTERNANIRSYNTVLKAYSQFKSGRNGYFSRPLKAEELLRQVSSCMEMAEAC